MATTQHRRGHYVNAEEIRDKWYEIGKKAMTTAKKTGFVVTGSAVGGVILALFLSTAYTKIVNDPAVPQAAVFDTIQQDVLKELDELKDFHDKVATFMLKGDRYSKPEADADKSIVNARMQRIEEDLHRTREEFIRESADQNATLRTMERDLAELKADMRRLMEILSE